MFFSKIKENLKKTKENLDIKISNVFASKKDIEEIIDDLEETLILSDIGVNTSTKICDNLREDLKKQTDKSEHAIKMLLKKQMEDILNKNSAYNDLEDDEKKVLLIVGVNGVGKTTTIAKLAKRYINQGKKVMLVAADTFRAGAKEQLTVWANRLNIPIVTGQDNEDPASVAYKGTKKGIDEEFDLVIIDTAGRLQNKKNLMEELRKIYNVVTKLSEKSPECFLVIDATTGQNGVLQAKAFKELINVTGIVITKMDGTSKGGIILAIREELGIPVRFIGLGEKDSDLEEFDLDKYLYGLCSSLIKDE